MKRLLILIASLGLIATSNAQLWNGDSLPDSWSGSYGIDPYFVPDGSGFSEFYYDTGFNFSLAEGGTKPIGITEDNGWFDVSTFTLTLEVGDIVNVTYLGNTAGWENDFGINLGNTNVSGGTASTIWESISDTDPTFGSQISFVADADTVIDLWLNSSNAENGGTYSMFYPETSEPENSGLPSFDYSARGKVFTVYDDIAGVERSILVIAIEDWRDYDADFTDLFIAIEIGTRFGDAQFPVPEPSTYGMIGAMLLLGLAAIRRTRRS